MPRLTPITEAAQVPAGGEADFQSLIRSRGRINAPQSMALYSPAVASRSTELNDELRRSLSKQDYELSVIVASREFPIEFVWSAHAATALKEGVSEALVEAVRTGGPLAAASPRERAIIQVGREIVGGKRLLSQETFDMAHAELGEKALIEVMMTMGYYLMIGVMLIGTAYEPRADAPPLPNLPR